MSRAERFNERFRAHLQKLRELLGLSLLGAGVRVLGIRPEEAVVAEARGEDVPVRPEALRGVEFTPAAQEMLAAGRRQAPKKDEPEPPLEGSVEAQRAGMPRFG